MYRFKDYKKLPNDIFEKLSSNNPYIKDIYDYNEFVLPYPDLDSFKKIWKCKFNPRSLINVEIGCGSGRYLTILAKQNPKDIFLGLELRFKRIVLAAKKVKKQKINNIILIRDFGEYLNEYLNENSIDRLHINFPDPWSKITKKKHRIINFKFLSMIHKLLKKNGVLLFKTDHIEYYNYVTNLFDNSVNYKIIENSTNLHRSKYAEKNIFTEFEVLFECKDKRPIFYLKIKSC